MRKEEFFEFIRELLALEEAPDEAKSVEIERLLGKLGIAGMATPKSIGNWYGSHTFTAFRESLAKI